MKDEKPAKKGFFGILRESFSKSGGCCGAGQTCGGPEAESDKAKIKKEDKEAKEADKPIQK